MRRRYLLEPKSVWRSNCGMARSAGVTSKLPRILRILHARPRLVLAALLGLGVIAVLPSQWPLAESALVGWDVGIAVYLAAAFWHVARGDIVGIRRQAAIEDEGQFAVLILTVAAALASIAAIVIELAGAKGNQPTPMAMALAVVTIMLSWAFIHVIFALHYAHEFYGEGSDKREGGLQFPEDDEPDYWDFIYFSFVVGMTFQVSDVVVTSKIVRRLVVAHGVVSFVFNTALLALMVNIAASAI
jgi:uncharacterized membrane protein